MRKHFLKTNKKITFLAFLLAFCLLGNTIKASSNNLQSRITIQKQLVPLKQVLEEIESQTNCSFLLRDSDININQEVSINVKNKNLKETLDVLFGQKGIHYEVKDNFITVFSPQQKSNKKLIRGLVADTAGEPAIGASVTIKGSQIGTACDMDGKFEIQATQNDVLVVTYIGYSSKEIKVANNNDLKIVLKENTELLEEVVIVGYGSQKKANLTGSVASVKMDEVMGDRPIVKAADALQGVVPGLLVSSGGNNAGASKSFQLRGAYSIGSKTAISPLVLIDNVEGDLDLINPEDIESITVLKDAASAAIYGARAAGGVVLVTTKRPTSATKFQLNYNNNFAFGKAMNLPKQAPLMNYLQAYSDAAGDQFWTMGSPSVSKWMGYLEQYQKDPSSLNVVGDGLFKDVDGAVYYLNEKDLVKNMLESSFQQTHNISATGGTEKIRYRLSGALTNNDGVLITDKDKFRRLNITSFVSADVTNWFTQEMNFSYASSKSTLPSSALGEIYGTRLASFYPEGVMPEGISTPDDAGLPFFTPKNQIEWSNPSTTLVDNPRIFLKSIVKPLKGLQVVFEYTFDKNIYDYNWYTGKVDYTTVQGGKDTTPTEDYQRKNKRYTNYNAINLYGTYERTINKDHNLTLMGGFNQESSYREALDVYSYGQAVVEVPSLGAGTSTLKAVDSYNEYAIRSGFFRFTYNYKQRYLLEANGRYDGSSKFPKGERFGFFPSVSLGWNIAEESFLANTRNWLDGLKLRGSYGKIGNQNIPTYAYTPTMSVNNNYGQWISNGKYVTAITSLPTLVRTNFTWEKVATTNIGLDFTLFHNKLSGSFDWYQRNTTGMLAPGVQLPAVVGADAPLQNTADMRTRGWELSTNWRDKIGDVEYRIGFNLSDNKSEITKYESNSSYLLSDFYKGQKLGEIWGYEFDGFYSVDDFESTSSWKLKEGVVGINGTNPRPGDVKFKNTRDDETFGKNIISAGDNTLDNPGDRKIIGNSTPRYLYGITLGANFKGFDINIFMQGTGKRDSWIANTLKFPLQGDFKFVPLYNGLDNYWKPVDAANGDYTAVNPNPEFPRIYGNYGNQGSNYRQSDKYLSDASYFRIKNVTLGYTFPKALASKIYLKNLKTFMSIENLATFSNLPKGIDPETLSWNYPAFRTISFGFNLTL